MNGNTASALLETGTLQKHLLPQLGLVVHLCLDRVNTEFRGTLLSTTAWQAVLQRSLPNAHPLCATTVASRKAALGYAATQCAIAAGEAVAK